MPKILCFEQNYEETAKAIAHIRERLAEGARNAAAGKKFRIIPGYNDFTTIEYISPSAALAIAAEYDAWRTPTKFDVPLIDLDDWDKRVKYRLHELGFFELLDIELPYPLLPAVDTKVMRFQSSLEVGREDVAGLTDSMSMQLIDRFPDLGEDTDFRITVMQILAAIQEATENACDHAYRNTGIIDLNRRWWATGAVNVRQRHLNLVVYDRGRSIPAALPEWEKYPFIASRLERLKTWPSKIWGADREDALKMRLAMDAPRSSTEHSHRGKGFPVFRALVEQSKMARLRILSRNGEFVYQKDGQREARPLSTPLEGALIEWDIWL